MAFSNWEEVDPNDDKTVCFSYAALWFSFNVSYQLKGNGGFIP